MAAKKTKKTGKGASGSVKSSVKRRTLNVTGSKSTVGDPFNDQDVQRRIGNFNTAGEHSRVGGNRQAGIIGQSKRKFGTDKAKKKGEPR